MAVVGIAQELPNSPSGKLDLNSQSFTRSFIVHTNSYFDGPLIVFNAIGIPRPFSLYGTYNEYHFTARAREFNCDRLAANSLAWKVDVEYRTPDPTRGENQKEVENQHDNPTLELPEISTHFETSQTVVYGKYNTGTGNLEPYQSTCGEIFDPPPMKDSSRLVLTVSRNEDILSPHPSLAITYQDAVNSDTFFGAAAGSAKVKSITCNRATKQTTSGATVVYLKVVYIIEFKDTWDLQILNAGTWAWDSVGLKNHIQFKTKDGHPTTGLVATDGTALPEGGTPVFITGRVYKRLAFSALNLPQSFLEVGV